MQAMGPNVAGVIGTAVAAGTMLAQLGRVNSKIKRIEKTRLFGGASFCAIRGLRQGKKEMKEDRIRPGKGSISKCEKMEQIVYLL